MLRLCSRPSQGSTVSIGNIFDILRNDVPDVTLLFPRLANPIEGVLTLAHDPVIDLRAGGHERLKVTLLGRDVRVVDAAKYDGGGRIALAQDPRQATGVAHSSSR